MHVDACWHGSCMSASLVEAVCNCRINSDCQLMPSMLVKSIGRQGPEWLQRWVGSTRDAELLLALWARVAYQFGEARDKYTTCTHLPKRDARSAIDWSQSGCWGRGRSMNVRDCMLRTWSQETADAELLQPYTPTVGTHANIFVNAPILLLNSKKTFSILSIFCQKSNTDFILFFTYSESELPGCRPTAVLHKIRTRIVFYCYKTVKIWHKINTIDITYSTW